MNLKSSFWNTSIFHTWRSFLMARSRPLLRGQASETWMWWEIILIAFELYLEFQVWDWQKKRWFMLCSRMRMAVSSDKGGSNWSRFNFLSLFFQCWMGDNLSRNSFSLYLLIIDQNQNGICQCHHRRLQCTMHLLKNRPQSSQLWQIVSLLIFIENLWNFVQSCRNSSKIWGFLKKKWRKK